jgi:hypothetical protein
LNRDLPRQAEPAIITGPEREPRIGPSDVTLHYIALLDDIQ